MENLRKEPHRCDICQKFFVSGRNLTLHTENAHAGNRKHFICKICGKSLTTNSILDKHIETVHERKKKPSVNYVKKLLHKSAI